MGRERFRRLAQTTLFIHSQIPPVSPSVAIRVRLLLMSPLTQMEIRPIPNLRSIMQLRAFLLMKMELPQQRHSTKHSPNGAGGLLRFDNWKITGRINFPSLPKMG